MASESKRREVLQLLKEWRSFHSPFGGAFALEDATMKDASYGPAGFIEEGMEYPKKQRGRLKQSYQDLSHAIEIEKATTEGMAAWLLLHECYFGDPGDPAIVSEWRKASDYRIDYHDRFISRLADHLRHKDLYVIWPARMSVREETQLERRNDELFKEYEQLKAEKIREGLPERSANAQAVNIAATRHGYRRSRAYEIVQIRTGKKAG